MRITISQLRQLIRESWFFAGGTSTPTSGGSDMNSVLDMGQHDQMPRAMMAAQELLPSMLELGGDTMEELVNALIDRGFSSRVAAAATAELWKQKNL